MTTQIIEPAPTAMQDARPHLSVVLAHETEKFQFWKIVSRHKHDRFFVLTEDGVVGAVTETSDALEFAPVKGSDYFDCCSADTFPDLVRAIEATEVPF